MLRLFVTLLLGCTSASADQIILPTIPGTETVDISKPGYRIQNGVVYQTRPGPLGIINQMGTTYKREGSVLVPHKGILGPQDFSKPSYRLETDSYGRTSGPLPVPVIAPRPVATWKPRGVLVPSVNRLSLYDDDDSKIHGRIDEQFEEHQDSTIDLEDELGEFEE